MDPSAVPQGDQVEISTVGGTIEGEEDNKGNHQCWVNMRKGNCVHISVRGEMLRAKMWWALKSESWLCTDDFRSRGIAGIYEISGKPISELNLPNCSKGQSKLAHYHLSFV